MFPKSQEIIDLMTTNPWALFELLGTFWQNDITDRDTLQIHEMAHHEIHADALTRADAMDSAASVFTVEPLRVQQWWALVLKESGLVVAPNLVVYGGPHTFGDGTAYGQVERNSYGWILPGTIKSVGLVVDHFMDPTAVFDVSNAWFDAATSVLRFDQNPFASVQATLLYDAAGQPILYTAADGTTRQDRSITLWARNVGFDQSDIFLRFGSIIKVPGTSSAPYQKVVESVWRTLVGGPSMDALWRGLLASAGLPYVVGNEIVQQIATDSDGLAIITDQRVYRAAATATAVVAVGNELVPGQRIVDTVVLIDGSSGVPPDLSDLEGIVLTPDLTDPPYGITISKLDSVWTSVPDPVTGRAQYRFEVVGSAADTEAFWTAVHARGIEEGTTLAEALQVAPGTAVNPLQFLISNFFNGRFLIILLKPTDFLTEQTGFLDRLRTLIPAGVLVLVQVALPPVQDTLTATGAFVDTTSLQDGTSASSTISVQSGSGDRVLTDFTPTLWNA